MVNLLTYLEHLIEITEYDIERIQVWLDGHRHRHFKPVAGRFAGMFYVDPKTGVFIVATQTLTVGVAETAPLVFVDDSGATGPGPIGTIAASDPSVTVSLSADGQFANATMTTTLATPVTLTWNDPAGVIPSFTVEVTDAATFVPVSGSFGTFAPGTTN